MIRTVVILDKDHFEDKLKYARTVASDELTFIFEPEYGLVKVGEVAVKLTGKVWESQVAGRLEQEILHGNLETPVEVVLLSTHPALSLFLERWRILGFISRPLDGLDDEEAAEWLRVRV